MLAWRLEEGFTEGFVYEHRAEVLKGIYADDPGLGGARLKGVTTAGGEMDPGVHEVDPVAFHVCCAWWRLQCEIEDTQPNAETVEGMIQLDTITERELYQEYYVAVTDADVAERHVLQFGPWKSLWQEHFSKVSIVVAKNLLSKVRCAERAPERTELLCDRPASVLELKQVAFVCFRTASGPSCASLHARKWGARLRSAPKWGISAACTARPSATSACFTTTTASARS